MFFFVMLMAPTLACGPAAAPAAQTQEAAGIRRMLAAEEARREAERQESLRSAPPPKAWVDTTPPVQHGEIPCENDRELRRGIHQRWLELQQEATRTERDRQLAAERVTYIQQHCPVVQVVTPAYACVDARGFVVVCPRDVEVYRQCPKDGPDGARGVIGGARLFSSSGDPSRVARTVSREQQARFDAQVLKSEVALEGRNRTCGDL